MRESSAGEFQIELEPLWVCTRKFGMGTNDVIEIIGPLLASIRETIRLADIPSGDPEMDRAFIEALGLRRAQ